MENNLDIVYLFGYSLRIGNRFEKLLPLLKIHLKHGLKVGVILIHDGVIGVSLKGKIPEAIRILLELQISLYVIIPDLKARGIPLEYIKEKINPIEYEDLVEILNTTPKIISWM